MKTAVLKFGGAAVATPAHFKRIAEIILERKSEFSRLVVVVSAMGKTTDELIQLAQLVHPNPPQREYDLLVSAGERISMALLAMALCRSGEIQAKSFTGSQSGIITCTNHTNARIIDVRPHRLLQTLDEGQIAIVAGFQGMSLDREVTTLGRGGSDTSAVALGAALGAEHVEFFKDVEGVFDKDPKKYPGLTPYSHLGYTQALEIILREEGRILHPRAVELAAANGIALWVRPFQREAKLDPTSEENKKVVHKGTWIYDAARTSTKSPTYEGR